jgi:hypothetical protein
VYCTYLLLKLASSSFVEETDPIFNKAFETLSQSWTPCIPPDRGQSHEYAVLSDGDINRFLPVSTPEPEQKISDFR